jgi:hypothetical protein
MANLELILLRPFEEVVAKGKLIPEAACAEDEDKSSVIAAVAKAVTNEGERALQKISKLLDSIPKIEELDLAEALGNNGRRITANFFLIRSWSLLSLRQTERSREYPGEYSV